MRGSKTPYPIQIKFCRAVDIPDIITFANFGENRLRGLGVTGGLPFSIDFDRRPYNTTVRVCDVPKTGGLLWGAGSWVPI